jgi:hypothetical protein
VMSMTSHAASSDLFDGRWQLGDLGYVVSDLQPTVANTFQAKDLSGGDTFLVRYAFQSRKWYANAKYSRMDDAVRTGAEFSRQTGNNRSEFELGRSWSGHGNDWWKRKTLRTVYEFSQNNDGQVLADRTITEIGIVTMNESSVQMQYHSGREFQAGRLIDFDRLVLTGNIKPRDDLEMGFETQVGDKMDLIGSRLAEQRRFRPFLNWKVNKQLALQLVNTNIDLNAREGQKIFNARLVDAHLTWQFDDRGSIRVSRRQSNVERNPDSYVTNVEKHLGDVAGEILYSWKLNSEAVFNLGYSDARIQDIELGAFTPVDGNWFMKVGYLLSF